MKEKILITGANGFIGKFIVETCISRNFDVFATVRKNSNLEGLKDLPIKILTVDYNNHESLTQIMSENNFDYIIHNAGLTKAEKYEDLLKANKGLVENLIHAIRASKINIKKFTLISSLAAYGPADFQPEGVVKDSSTPNPVTMYGRSKLEGEKYLQMQNDIPYVIIRPTAVYGPGEKDLFNVFKMISKRMDIKPALLGQKLTFIYVKDLVRLIVDATTSSHQRKAWFATDGNVYTGDAFNGFIKEGLNKMAISIKIPIFILKAAAYASEKIGKMRNDYPILNQDKVNELKAGSWHCDVKNLKSDLNFEAEYSLQNGIPETIQWYKSNGWLS